MRPKINILMFWFAGEKTWDEGRTYQKVAEHLSVLEEVRRVVVAFPPARPTGQFRWPLKTRHVTAKLELVTESNQCVPMDGAGFAVRKFANGFLTRHSLRAYLHYLGFRTEDTILWLFPPHPYLDSLISRVPHRLLVAHVVDNFTTHGDPWLSRYAESQYPVLTAKADVVIVGSQSNLDAFSANRSGTYLFENAVDEDFIGEPSATPVNRDGPPKLGYVGTLSERTDFQLLEFLARSRPDWELLIAGKSEYALADLPFLSLPNVRYLGVIPYRDLPPFLRTLDVCLIPHRNTEYSRSMSPLKLFQYLASGRPVVSSEISGLEKAGSLVTVVSSPGDFVEAIARVLKEDTIEHSARRIEFARNETWERRVREMFDVVASRLAS